MNSATVNQLSEICETISRNLPLKTLIEKMLRGEPLTKILLCGINQSSNTGNKLDASENIED
jgi:hypothetical protein